MDLNDRAPIVSLFVSWTALLCFFGLPTVVAGQSPEPSYWLDPSEYSPDPMDRWRGTLPQELPDFTRPALLTRGIKGSISSWKEATVIVLSPHEFGSNPVLSFGSGAVISSDGWILTNYHVVAGPVQGAAKTGTTPVRVEVITCEVVENRTRKREEHLGGVVYRVDPVRDLALIKLDPPPEHKMSYFKLAKRIHETEDGYAIGSQGGGPAWAIKPGKVTGPYVFPLDLTEIILGLDTTSAIYMREKLDILKSTCEISSGDSGGPLINRSGELMGLTFATPVNLTQGSVGYHIAATEIEAFLHPWPESPEYAPLDTWTAGFPESDKMNPAMHRVQDDGIPTDVLRYTYIYNGTALVAQGVFFKFNGDTTQVESPTMKLPAGLWGMEDKGAFQFDAFVLVRFDSVLVLGYTDEDYILSEIRIDSDSDENADVVWNRSKDGMWKSENSADPVSILDVSRLSSGKLERLRDAIGQNPWK